MSYSIVGNNKTPDFFLAWYEVCIDEDEDEYEKAEDAFDEFLDSVEFDELYTE